MTATIPPDDQADAQPPRRAPGRRRDGGFTFIETVLTVVLMGIVIVPVLAAVRGVVRASSTSEDAAKVEIILINAVDRIHRASPSTCDLTGDAKDALPTEAEWLDRMTVEQEVLDPAGNWVASFACADARRITLTVRSPGDRVKRELQVIQTELEVVESDD